MTKVTDLLKLKNDASEDAIVKSIEEEQAAIACSLDDPDGCEMCSG